LESEFLEVGSGGLNEAVAVHVMEWFWVIGAGRESAGMLWMLPPAAFEDVSSGKHVGVFPFCRVASDEEIAAAPKMKGYDTYLRREKANHGKPFFADENYTRIIRRMGELGFHARVKSPFTEQSPWTAGFTPLGTSGFNGRPDHEASANSPGVAVAAAALDAVGVPVKLIEDLEGSEGLISRLGEPIS